MLKHRAAGRPLRAATALPGRRSPSLSFMAAPSLSACCPVCTPHPGWRKGGGASGGALWVCLLLLPRPSPGRAVPGLTWLCAIHHSVPSSRTRCGFGCFSPWTELFLSISISVPWSQAPCPHQHVFLHRGEEARPPAPTLLPADGSMAAGAPGTHPACPARRAAAQPGNPAQRQPSDFSGKARNPGFKVKSPHFKTLAANSPKTK